VHVPCGDKSDDVQHSLYEKPGHVFDLFPRYYTKMFLGDFNVKVGRDSISKPTIWKESSHEISNDNGVQVINFATSKNLVVKIQCSNTGTFINTPGPLLRERHTSRLITF
jgi:hypothetical protein